MPSEVALHFNDGTIFRAWDRLVLKESFLDPLGGMSFSVTPPRNLWSTYAEHFKKGELVSCLVDGAPQGVGIIQTVTQSIGKDTISWDIDCESVLAAAFEGNADPNYALSTTSDVPISAAVLDIMRPFGFSEVVVAAEDDVSARLGKPLDGKPQKKRRINVDALKHQDCKVNEGETAYGLVDRIVNRLGIILHVDVGGRLLLTKPIYDSPAQYSLVSAFDLGRSGDWLLAPITITDTNRGQFSETVVRGQRADKTQQTAASLPIARVGVPGQSLPSGLPFEKVKLEELPAGRHHYRSAVSPYKPKFYLDKKSRDAGRCTNTCHLIMGAKAKNAFVVQGSVDGFKAKTGALWSVNTVARTAIEAAAIDEDMWILERVFTQSRGGGQRTLMKLLPKYSLELGELGGGS